MDYYTLEYNKILTNGVRKIHPRENFSLQKLIQVSTRKALYQQNATTSQVFGTCSVITTAAITVDKYIAVQHSLRYYAIVTWSRIKASVMGIWAVSFVLGHLPFIIAGLGVVFSFCIFSIYVRWEIRFSRRFVLMIFSMISNLI